jgi:putative aminopeptidase FrvX
VKHDRLRADLIDLMLIPGLSGHEERVAAAIASALLPRASKAAPTGWAT